MKARVFQILHGLSRWLFWPGLGLVTWGELRAEAPDLPLYVFGIVPLDKVQHFTAYFGLGSMAAMVLGPRYRLPAVAALILYSGALEIVQAYIGRDASWFDLLANAIGASNGLGAALLMLCWTGRLAKPGQRH